MALPLDRLPRDLEVARNVVDVEQLGQRYRFVHQFARRGAGLRRMPHWMPSINASSTLSGA